MPNQLPSLRRRGEARVPVAQVIGVRLMGAGERSENRHGIGVGKRQGGNGMVAAGDS